MLGDFFFARCHAARGVKFLVGINRDFQVVKIHKVSYLDCLFIYRYRLLCNSLLLKQ